VTLALVGAGFAGSIHAQAWAGIEDARVATVVDPDLARGEALAGRLGSRWTTTIEEALADAEVDAVDVCAPTALHAELTVAAAEAGRHVLCEKPIALDLAGADRAIDACRRAGVALMVGHVLRFWPEYEFLRGLLCDGSLGRLRSLTCSRLVQAPTWTAGDWLLDPGQSLGVAGEVMIHDLDFLTSNFGRPRAVSATALRDPAGWGHMQAMLRYDGVLASAEAGWGSPPEQPFAAGFRAVFEGGILEYDSRSSPTLSAKGAHIAPLGNTGGATKGGPWSFDAVGYARELEYFVRCVCEEAEPNRCPPADARESLALAIAAIESAESGAEVRFL
jgi:predicted dehydrogenase